MSREVYLDNSSTTRPLDEVIECINHVNKDVYGNPSSLHKKGIESEKLIKKARESIAASLNAESKEIYFTSGGTESNNLAIRGYLEANSRIGNHIITTAIEHPAVLETYKYLSDNGYKVDYIDVDNNGVINLQHLEQKINSETALISIIYVNNEVGSIQPIEEIVRIKNSINKHTAIHVDAVQAYGKLKISPRNIGIDMMAISSHKIHGPKGMGALYVNKAIKIKPIIFGGGQESLLRSGTENVSGICGFGLASEIIFKSIDDSWEKVCKLKNLFLELLQNNVDNYKVISKGDCSPYVLNIAFGGLKAEVLLHHLEEKNIYVSTGSACSSRKNVHSHVLKAMEIERCDIEGAIRFSFSSFNNEEDIRDTIAALVDIVPKIQIRRGGRR